MMKKLLMLLLAVALLAGLTTALADVDSSGVNGTNEGETTFYVNVTSTSASVTLQGVLGTANVSHGSTWDSPGVWT